MLGLDRWMQRVAFAIAVVATGCGADDLFGDDDTGDDPGNGASDSGDGEGDGDGDGDGETGGTGDEATGGGDDDSGGDPDDGGDEQACDGVDCGPGGSCVVGPDAEPRCECEPGYADLGLRCEACAQSGGTLNIDIPTVAVGGTITVNGGPAPDSRYDRGDLVLVNRSSGDEVLLGSTVDGGFSVNVVRGTYELFYRNREGGVAVPANRNARLAVVELRDAADLDVDLEVVQVSGALTLNGEAPPASAYERGAIVLRNSATGDSVDLGSTRDGSYTVSVLPGTYDVHYALEQGGEHVPQNRDARLRQVTVQRIVGIQEGPGPLRMPVELDIDVPMVNARGTITVNGMTAPDSPYDSGRLVLRGGGGDEVVLGTTRSGAYSVNVVPGAYDLHFESTQAGSVTPQNGNVVVTTLDVSEGEADIDVPVVEVTGALTVGGDTPPDAATDDGTLLMRDRRTGDALALGSTRSGAYAARIVPGNYDLFYRQQSSNGGVPANTNTSLGELDTLSGTVRDVDVPTATVSGSITVDMMEPPDTEYDDGRVYLKNTETGDTALLGRTQDGSFERLVTPGTYEIRYALETSTQVMPINNDAFLGTTVVQGDMAVDVDIPTRTLEGDITIGGQAPPVSAYDRGRVMLRDVATGDLVYLAETVDGGYVAPIVPGTYVILYEAERSAGGVPSNRSAAFACVDLDEAG